MPTLSSSLTIIIYMLKLICSRTLGYGGLMPTAGNRRRTAKRFSEACNTRKSPFRQAQPPYTRPGKHHFWLVQRLERPNRSDAGELFNGVFAAEHMGHVEFEFGAVDETLSRIRKTQVVIRSCSITHRGVTRTVYFVGPRQGMNEKVADFKTWLQNPLTSKDRTHFSEIFTGVFPLYKNPTSRRRWGWLRTRAWLSLQNDIGWALNPRTARELKRAFA